VNDFNALLFDQFPQNSRYLERSSPLVEFDPVEFFIRFLVLSDPGHDIDIMPTFLQLAGEIPHYVFGSFCPRRIYVACNQTDFHFQFLLNFTYQLWNNGRKISWFLKTEFIIEMILTKSLFPNIFDLSKGAMNIPDMFSISPGAPEVM